MTTAALAPQTTYDASADVRQALTRIGRTEDVAFSPDGTKLALAALHSNHILILDVEAPRATDGARHVRLTGGVLLSSPAIAQPHGVDFVDSNSIAVASRGSGVSIFEVPSGGPTVPEREVQALATRLCGEGEPIGMVGSVRTIGRDTGHPTLLLCDNTRRAIVGQPITPVGAPAPQAHVLLHKYIDLPDGANVSPDSRYLAVSNHDIHHVAIFDQSEPLSPDSAPVGMLRGVVYPHGLCFSSDGAYLFVAEAEGPRIDLFAREPRNWRGIRYPVASFRVMDDATFAAGRVGPGEGGPKGLDIHHPSGLLAVTCHHVPLALFDVNTLLENARAVAASAERAELDFECELLVLQEHLARVDKLAHNNRIVRYVLNSRSWKLTAPLRRFDEIRRKR